MARTAKLSLINRDTKRWYTHFSVHKTESFYSGKVQKLLLVGSRFVGNTCTFVRNPAENDSVLSDFPKRMFTNGHFSPLKPGLKCRKWTKNQGKNRYLLGGFLARIDGLGLESDPKIGAMWVISDPETPFLRSPKVQNTLNSSLLSHKEPTLGDLQDPLYQEIKGKSTCTALR